VVFTKAGEDAVALAKEMNAGVARLMASEAVAGEVKVASFPAHVTNVLAHAARRTQVRHPGTRFVWSANEAHRADGGSSLVSRMEAGEFDVVVCSKGARGVPAKRSAELYRWELCAVGQGLGPEVTLDGLVGREIGTSPERHLSRTLLDGELSRRSLRIQEAFAKPIETESTEALLALAIEGFLVAIVPSDSVPAGVTWTRLRLAGGRTRGGAYVMAWCEDPSAAVADFVTEATSWGDALGQVPLVPLSGSAPG
jgi:DNA-binding transcriptional LysR family regulator